MTRVLFGILVALSLHLSAPAFAVDCIPWGGHASSVDLGTKTSLAVGGSDGPFGPDVYQAEFYKNDNAALYWEQPANAQTYLYMFENNETETDPPYSVNFAFVVPGSTELDVDVYYTQGSSHGGPPIDGCWATTWPIQVRPLQIISDAGSVAGTFNGLTIMNEGGTLQINSDPVAFQLTCGADGFETDGLCGTIDIVSYHYCVSSSASNVRYEAQAMEVLYNPGAEPWTNGNQQTVLAGQSVGIEAQAQIRDQVATTIDGVVMDKALVVQQHNIYLAYQNVRQADQPQPGPIVAEAIGAWNYQVNYVAGSPIVQANNYAFAVPAQQNIFVPQWNGAYFGGPPTLTAVNWTGSCF